jgi:hypothetical protein
VSESPSDGQHSEDQHNDVQHNDVQHGDDQHSDDQHSDGPLAAEQPSEPKSERPGEWRSDWSGSRFTEPPNRPSGESASRPASDRPSKPSGDRQKQPSGNRPGKSANDPVADFQRWLMKAGARSMANQVADNVRRTLNQPKRDKGDVWDTATTEPPPDEPPECQWCPVCQAARRIRVSGTLGDRLANAGGVLASVVQDAFSAVDKAMKAQPPEDGQQDRAS